MTKFSTEFEVHLNANHQRGRPWATLPKPSPPWATVRGTSPQVYPQWKAKEGRYIIHVRIISSFAIIIIECKISNCSYQSKKKKDDGGGAVGGAIE
jgi:hypothetical protein